MRTKAKILIVFIMSIVPGCMMAYPQDGNRKSIEEADTLICLPLGIDLTLREYQDSTKDTIFVCVYDTVSIVSGYAGPLELLYKWSNGSSSHELTAFTTGVGNDIQKIWLEVTDPQTGCLYSDTLTIIYQFGYCVGIKTTLKARSARIFPNPAQDILTVEYHGDTHPAQLFVVDVEGRVVYQKSIVNELDGIQQIQLDLHFLPSGLYLVKLISEKDLFTGKILLH